jgi:transketolase
MNGKLTVISTYSNCAREGISTEALPSIGITLLRKVIAVMDDVIIGNDSHTSS